MSTAAVITINYHSSKLINRIETQLCGQSDVRLYVIDNSGNFVPASASTVVIDPNGNIGFARACNLGARRSTEEILLFHNPDAETDLATIRALTVEMSDTENTIWGPVIDNGNGWTSAIVRNDSAFLPYLRIAFPVGCTPQPTSIYVSGACLGVRRELFLSLGGFNEAIFMYGEDVDFCINAAAAGIKIETLENIVLRHVGGRSSSRIRTRFLRLIKSIKGHYTFLSRYHTKLVSAVSAVYLASGRATKIGDDKCLRSPAAT
jgi:N-acetylglucosaminyl-diphospho-decaprenol L-rhamnosyltransferase